MVREKIFFVPFTLISFNPGLGWGRCVFWVSSPQPLWQLGTDFVEDNFSTNGEGSNLGRFRCITFIVYFISFIITDDASLHRGIRSHRLGTPVLCHLPELLMGLLFHLPSGSLPGNALPWLLSCLSQLPAPLRGLLLQNKLTALYLSKGLLTIKFKRRKQIILNWEEYYISFSCPPALPSSHSTLVWFLRLKWNRSSHQTWALYKWG